MSTHYNRTWLAYPLTGLRKAVAEDKAIRRQAARLGLTASRRGGWWTLTDRAEGQIVAGLYDWQATAFLARLCNHASVFDWPASGALMRARRRILGAAV